MSRRKIVMDRDRRRTCATSTWLRNKPSPVVHRSRLNVFPEDVDTRTMFRWIGTMNIQHCPSFRCNLSNRPQDKSLQQTEWSDTCPPTQLQTRVLQWRDEIVPHVQCIGDILNVLSMWQTILYIQRNEDTQRHSSSSLKKLEEFCKVSQLWETSQLFPYLTPKSTFLPNPHIWRRTHTAKSPSTKDCLSYAKPTPLPHARTTSLTPSQHTMVAQLRPHLSNPRKIREETWWH